VDPACKETDSKKTLKELKATETTESRTTSEEKFRQLRPERVNNDKPGFHGDEDSSRGLLVVKSRNVLGYQNCTVSQLKRLRLRSTVA